MDIYLIDGTYELFRFFYAVPSDKDTCGQEIGAVRGVLGSVLSMIEGGATHVGVATDHVIESFRNDLYLGYKTGEGVDPARSEEHTSELQSQSNLVCRLLLDKKISFKALPEGASPYGPNPIRPASYAIDRDRIERGFAPSALDDALAKALACYRVALPSHPGS